MDSSQDLLIRVEHVKYRKSEGKSPIGILQVFTEHLEWRENPSTGSEVLHIEFADVKVQRVSAPNKAKVQLQVVLSKGDEQATFVFLAPGKSKEELVNERDTVQETLQQALLAHRAKYSQLSLSSTSEKSEKVHWEAKQRLLLQNKQLGKLYMHLVSTKLLPSSDFWSNHYQTTGQSEDKAGIGGAFLANIAHQDGTNGVTLSLNDDIIQAVFNTYPVVQRKYLELVPHEMTEESFWKKFFQSHYFHREREVLPNPDDPFSDCVRMDDAEMDGLVSEGVARKRFDLNQLDDNALNDYSVKPESTRGTKNGNLIRRCNYLSERLTALKPSTSTAPVENGKGDAKPSGYALKSRIVDEDENRLESMELAEEKETVDGQTVSIGLQQAAMNSSFSNEDAEAYRQLVFDFLERNDDASILNTEDDECWMDGDDDNTMNGYHNGVHKDNPVDWNLSPAALSDLRSIHEACTELLRHFWHCFPSMNQEMDDKIERMMTTLKNYEMGLLAEANQKYGRENVEHCYDMLNRAYAKYEAYASRKEKK